MVSFGAVHRVMATNHSPSGADSSMLAAALSGNPPLVRLFALLRSITGAGAGPEETLRRDSSYRSSSGPSLMPGYTCAVTKVRNSARRAIPEIRRTGWFLTVIAERQDRHFGKIFNRVFDARNHVRIVVR